MDEKTNALCKALTFLLIQNDCETLKTLLLTIQDPVFSMGILPYLALFCKAFQEYTNVELINNNVNSEISNIRNSIKMFENRYGKIKNSILAINSNEDDSYKKQLRFGFLRKFNVHYDLGIYFSENQKVILNTNLCMKFFNLDNQRTNDINKNQKAFSIGENLGSIVGIASKGLSSYSTVPVIKIKHICHKNMYLDINTNRNRFFSKRFNKDINLMLLHLLSFLNFVQYYLEPMIEKTNPWLLRVKYISTYYCYRGLFRLVSHIKHNNNIRNSGEIIKSIGVLLDKGAELFVGKFRNCMMHYDLNNKGDCAISKEEYNPNIPFFGLIESCFNGISYDEYFIRLSEYGKEIDKCISSFFNIKEAKLKAL